MNERFAAHGAVDSRKVFGSGLQHWSLMLLLLLATPLCQALEVPQLQGRVTDDAQMLSAEARERIAEVLRSHEARTGNQIAVLTVTTLDGDKIEAFAVRVFESWKLGKRGKDTGVLFVIAARDRQMRIEVGYGLEGSLPDVRASRIIREVITPLFKRGAYDAGVEAGVRAVVGTLEGSDADALEAAPVQDAVDQSASRMDPELRAQLYFAGFGIVILTVFAVVGVIGPSGLGWFFYFFGIPFLILCFRSAIGFEGMIAVVGTYVIAVPILRVVTRRRCKENFGSGTLADSNDAYESSPAWNDSSTSASSSSDDFSGGGGQSGGGGASGRW